MVKAPDVREEENAILVLCRGGDKVAFEKLIVMYTPIVRKHVLQMLHQYGCSKRINEYQEEIVQQIWMELFRQFNKFPEEKFAVWFAFLRRWKTIDYIRKELKYQNRHPAAGDNPYTQGDNFPESNKNPEDIAHDKQIHTELRKCLEKIPRKQREFINLYYFQHWTYQSIGDHMGIGIGSVGSLHTRAIKKLKVLVKKTPNIMNYFSLSDRLIG